MTEDTKTSSSLPAGRISITHPHSIKVRTWVFTPPAAASNEEGQTFTGLQQQASDQQ